MYNIYAGDPVRAHEAHEISLYVFEQLRPVCNRCGEHIAEDSGYYLGGEWYCRDCVEASENFFDT